MDDYVQPAEIVVASACAGDSPSTSRLWYRLALGAGTTRRAFTLARCFPRTRVG
jgi:hypothetical protein